MTLTYHKAPQEPSLASGASPEFVGCFVGLTPHTIKNYLNISDAYMGIKVPFLGTILVLICTKSGGSDWAAAQCPLGQTEPFFKQPAYRSDSRPTSG
jgi:hypothetical protein